jgi:LuxR family transcriptional regulator, quorum-sensing system regulator CciR
MARGEGELARRAFEAVAALRAAPSLAALDGVVAPLFADLDYPWFAAARFFRPDRAPAMEVVSGRHNDAWVAHSLACGYGRVSRFAAQMLVRADPYYFSDLAETGLVDAVQQRILEEARGHGIVGGLYVPMRWHDGSYAAVALNSSGRDSADPLRRAMVEVVATYYGTEARRLAAANAAPAAPPPLSPRQRECLAWVRQGKSSAAIAAILGLSVPTIDGYIAEACRKLGVRTRVQAAVEASLRGLLDH